MFAPSQTLSFLKMLFNKVFYFIVFMLIFTSVYAHGDLTIRIEEKTKEIAKSPKNATLFFERGFLYQQHLEYKKAIKDYLKSKKLHLNSDELKFRIAETYYFNGDFKKALKATQVYLNEVDATDVKIIKLQAQIFFNLKQFNKALTSYNYVLKNTIDLRPEDIIEYTNIIFAIDSENYNDALKAIEIGLNKLGENTLTLQLKKLEYLTALNQTEKIISQYNYFILNSQRKEFWYYKKAKYLAEINKIPASNIAIQQSKTAITILKSKTQNTLAIQNLIVQINELEKAISYD
jgi:tetratricopeptide (TPR) repeat protein